VVVVVVVVVVGVVISKHLFMTSRSVLHAFCQCVVDGGTPAASEAYQTLLLTNLKKWLAVSQENDDKDADDNDGGGGDSSSWRAVLAGLPVLLEGFLQHRASQSSINLDGAVVGSKRKADAMASSRQASMTRAQFVFGLRLWDLATQGLDDFPTTADRWYQLTERLEVGKSVLAMLRDRGVYNYDVDSK